MTLLKNVFAGVASLAVVLTLALTATPAAAGTPQFTDISGHWAEGYITELAEAGIVSTENADGTAKTHYYPDNSLSRAELTKLAVEAFYGDTVSDLADAFADPNNPSFSDVAPSAWYFNYVEIAKGLDIVQGTGNGMFSPNAAITRAATLKVILLAGDIETVLDPANPFTDVPANAWFNDYVTSAYNHCIVNGTSATTFSPNGNVTRAEVAKILSNAMKVANGEDICTSDEDNGDQGDNGDEGDNGDQGDQGDNGDEDNNTATGGLEVSLSADNPAGSSVPKNGSNVPFLALDFTNTSNEDVEVTGVVIAHGGLGNENEIGDVKIFEGLTQRGSGRSFTSDQEIAPINMAADPVVVPAGSTVTVVVAADITASASGGEHTASVLEASDITAVGADSGAAVDVTGDFPLQGNTMVVANVSVGELGFIFKKPAANPSVEVGNTDEEIGRIQVKAGSAEDVLLQAITLEFDGVKDGNLGNVYAEFQGQRISNIIDVINNETGTLDFTDNADGGWLLNDGDTRTIRIKADILSGVSEDVTVKFDEIDSDVVATGMTYGFGVGICEAGNAGTICATDANASLADRKVTINGGDLTFSIDSTARDVAPDTNEVEFGTLTIKNMGEAIELKDGLTIILDVDTTGIDSNGAVDAANATDFNTITNVRLVDANTGATIMGPTDPAAGAIADESSSATQSLALDDQIVINEGQTLVLAVVADVESTAKDGAKYSFGVDMSKVRVEGVVSGESQTGTSGTTFDIKPSSDPYTKDYTIAAPTVTFSGTALNNDNFVKDAEDVLVWAGTVRANDVEDLYIRSLAFTNGGTATNVDVDDYSIYVVDGSTTTPQETNTDTTGTTADVVFSDLNEDGTSGILVPAGEELTLEVRANISANPTLNNTIILSLDVSEIDAEDEDGDNATVLPTTDIASATFTLKTQGSLDVTLDNNTPDAGIVVAGLSDVPASVYQFSATNEDVSVEDLMVNIVSVNTAGTLGADASNDYKAVKDVALFYYDDGTAVKQTNGSAATATVNTSGEALFQGLDLIIADGDDTLVEVRVNLNDMDDQNSGATAESGMTFRAEVDPADAKSDIKGVDSGAVLSVSNPTSNANELYVFNNHVIAELASGQATNLSTSTTQELLKFTLTSSGDNNDAPSLVTVVATVNLTDADAGGELAVSAPKLYNDDNQSVGTCTYAAPTITCATINDEIAGGTETYRLEATVAGVEADDKITTNIAINAAAPGSDGITWKDGGSDGTNGLNVQWIDLGSADTSTNRIENVVSN